MRGVRRTGLGGRGRGRGAGNARNRSPGPSTIREHQPRSGYHNNPPSSHRQSSRGISPQAERRDPQRSRSPLPYRPQRSPVPQGSPIGRRGERDYALGRAEHGERDYSLGRVEHGERDYALRRLEQEKHRPTQFEDEGIDFQHKYMLPEHPTDLNDVHALLKSSRTVKDKDFAGSSSTGIGSRGALVQKSLYLDDGSKRTFYTLPHDTTHPLDSDALKPSVHMKSTGSGSGLNVGMPSTDLRPRGPYDDREREKLYSRDVSFSAMPPLSQTRSYVSTSSTGFSEDADALRLYGDRVGAGKLLDNPLGHNDYNQVQFSDRMRRAPLSTSAGDKPLHHDYNEGGRRGRVAQGYIPSDAQNGYNEAGRRGRDDQGYIPTEAPCHKTMYAVRDEYRDPIGTSFLDLKGGRVDRDDAHRNKYSEGRLWEQHRSVHGDAAMDFHDLDGVHEDYVGNSGSGYAGLGLKVSRDDDIPLPEENLHLGRGVTSASYRERHDNNVLAHHPLDTFRHGMSSSREEARPDDHFDDFGHSPERMWRRNYGISDDLHGQDVHMRIQPPSHVDEMWSHEEYEYAEKSRRFLHPKKTVVGHSQRKLPSRKLLRNEGRGAISDSSAFVGGGQGISSKKRLRTGPSEFHDSYASDQRQEFLRPQKVWKRGKEDRNNSRNTHGGDVSSYAAHRIKKDPPEGSEEFKQQIHKAFLRFCKLLNESPHQQKRFRDDQDKSSKLLCCVCGSLSKEFVDVHSLLTHSYHSLKAGLRTDHLGLHKALCVLNGWNWLLAPDDLKSYRQRPSEIKALKEDLILWPPVVIIHNSSIGNKSKPNGPKVVSIGRMEDILKEMGFGAGKTKVSRGKPANQSVLLVKFMPTLSGLQEAERLHKYYADNNRGKERFQQITSTNSSDGEARVERDEELLYGYMAVAEDLDKLDPETKKRSLVKSKKEIEAIADAPLKID